MKRYEIYIGLKDKDTYTENFSAIEVGKILSNICERKRIAFSTTLQLGGYTHNKGYVTETSIRITLIGASLKDSKALGKEMMKIVNTDTIMITSEDCDVMYI